ncbi:M23 family metallopeptidase [Novosphingobium sp. MMS21-SN21R]|uniref:M23 family metallopeptidase n=1 Tax=Novosphingobium sp. MMS21-SN21R TaxID=2969298 RepID=UPI0028861990|nr:M23 family metallopeptidase [Novosphingobium sp. MMS21-SN21R]MDT0507152.1 M23 family metallopeptidase [Novosphingobium sp. MMS21-SN21R]
MRRLAAALLLLAAPAVLAQQGGSAPIVAWTYVVQPGDTFAQIARRWGTDMAALGAANGIASPYVIRVGQVLRRPESGKALAPAPSSSPTPKPTPRTAPTLRPAPPARPPLAPRESDAPRMQWPTEGAVITRFGEKVAGIPSNGIDLAALYGTKVRAAAAGTVIYAGREPERFGQLILIDHGGGFVTAYAYLGTMTVKEGQVVTARERIALVGKTGEALRPSIHFELRRNNVPRNPELYLPPRL